MRSISTLLIGFIIIIIIIIIIIEIVLEAHKLIDTKMQKIKNTQTTQNKNTNKLG